MLNAQRVAPVKVEDGARDVGGVLLQLLLIFLHLLSFLLPCPCHAEYLNIHSEGVGRVSMLTQILATRFQQDKQTSGTQGPSDRMLLNAQAPFFAEHLFAQQHIC